MEWSAADGGPRRPSAGDHSETLRVERREVHPRDRLPGSRYSRLLGSARLFQHRRSVDRRSLRSAIGNRRDIEAVRTNNSLWTFAGFLPPHPHPLPQGEGGGEAEGRLQTANTAIFIATLIRGAC